MFLTDAILLFKLLFIMYISDTTLDFTLIVFICEFVS